MWYVLHCPGGNEETIIRSCKQKLNSRILKDAFIFTYERMKRYQGSWHLETHNMFPDYVFLESENQQALFDELEQYRGIATAMKEQNLLIPISGEEERLLQELCGSEHHMTMSKGVIQDGITHVTEGPLAGRENMIARIDRHKRLAFLNTAVFPNHKSMTAGLEIVSKN